MRSAACLMWGLLVACGSDGPSAPADGAEGGEAGDTAARDEAAETPGQRLYAEPVTGGNTFACATCHALVEPAPDGMRRPGHPIGDATLRPHYKNGQLATLAEAVDGCLTEWMNTQPWGPEDERFVALSEFLAVQTAGGSGDALSFEIVEPPGDLAGGDADTGEAVFNQTCAACHGQGGGGSVRAIPVAGRMLDPEYIALRVRSSGLTESVVYAGLTGGRMPFWAADRLSDEELRDIVAWLPGSVEAPFEPGPEPMGDGDGDGDGDGGGDGDGSDAGSDGCGADHARVGETAELSMMFHGVTGRAEIIDDCTIEITDFGYDGTGIDVRIYGGLGGDYGRGFAMTADLLKPGGYDGVTLTARVPAGKTLDDLDGISVWCVDVGVDFGSASF